MTVPHLLRGSIWLLLLGALGLSAWWLHLDVATRHRHLLALWQGEGLTTPPPLDLWPQVCWLASERWQELRGMVGLGLLGALCGAGEGLSWRLRDVRRGYRLTCWTLGIAGVLLLLGLVLGMLTLPWALSMLWPCVLVPLLSGGALWCLVVGKPAMP